jgi:hypothetical protein
MRALALFPLDLAVEIEDVKYQQAIDDANHD